MTAPPRYHAGPEGALTRLTDRGARATAQIDPARGNNVVQLRVPPPGGPPGDPAGAPAGDALDVLLPPAGPDGLGSGGYMAGNPILFPFPNRVRGGRYTFEGQEHRLDVNETALGNHIHGLVARAPWRVEETGADDLQGAWQRASITLADVPGVSRQYPFPVTLTVTTRLHEGVLIQDIRAHNTGAGRLPMGFGTHPWFPGALGVPGAPGAPGAAPRAETLVRVPGHRYWRLEGLVPTGETVPVDSVADRAKFDLRAWRPLDGHAYDDVYTDLVRRADGWSEAGIRFPAAGLEIAVEASPEFREWVIYAPTERAVVCLEPYTGTTDAVNLQTRGVDAGLVVLEPGGSWRGTIRTSLRRIPPGQ